jgi:hypothetical protein
MNLSTHTALIVQSKEALPSANDETDSAVFGQFPSASALLSLVSLSTFGIYSLPIA